MRRRRDHSDTGGSDFVTHHARPAPKASPLERAEAAHNNGERFFELVIRRTFQPDENVPGLLADVEAVGWNLTHVSDGSIGSELPLSMYLFRRADLYIDLVQAEDMPHAIKAEPAQAAIPAQGFDPTSWPAWQAQLPGADADTEWPVWLQTWAVRSGWYVRRHG
jgi:hypothetical protein